MSKIDALIQSSKLLSKEHQLYKPHHERSVAGFIPEVLAHLSSDVNFGDNIVRNKDMANQIEESFPSGYKQAIVIIADGVGAQHLEKLGGLLADNMETAGTVASTMFPSMTSTVMSSISRGMYPASHGVVGYNLFNEHIGDIWSALAMRYKKNGEDHLVLDDFDLSQLISGDSLFSSFSNNSQPFIAPDQLGDPSLLDLIIPQMPLLTYTDVESGIKSIMQLLQGGNPFNGFYYPFADHLGHHHGPESKEYAEAIGGLDIVIQNLLQIPSVKSGDTAIFVTSDHGQSQIDHSISHWMTRDKWQLYRDQGVTLSTSGRTIHAYCDESARDRGKAILERLAGSRGVVIDNKVAMEMAGSKYAGHKFAIRMGDFVMIMEDGYLHDVPERVVLEDETRLHGQHGSLTSKELFVPVGIFGGQ